MVNDMAETRRGRPLKFGEPTVVRQFRFPKSLNERLIAHAQLEGRDDVDVLRQALATYINENKDGVKQKEPALEKNLGIYPNNELWDALFSERVQIVIAKEVKAILDESRSVSAEEDFIKTTTLDLQQEESGNSQLLKLWKWSKPPTKEELKAYAALLELEKPQDTSQPKRTGRKYKRLTDYEPPPNPLPPSTESTEPGRVSRKFRKLD